MIQWDPNPIFWRVPVISLDIAWYGVIFAGGFFLGYLLMCKLVERALGDRKLAVKYTDRLLIFCVIGTVVGARLGHVFFYDWPLYRENLLSIFNLRQGGLASHGGAVGVLLAMTIFHLSIRKRFDIPFWPLLDMVVIPTIFIGACIRVGNFVNQEVIGTPTNLPWAVQFMHPFGGGAPVPRHPAQLYEAGCYFLIFAFLWILHGKVVRRGGMISGLFFILVFGSRFFLEFVKVHQSASLRSDALFSMGQLLSIPFVIIGCALFIKGLRKKEVA